MKVILASASPRRREILKTIISDFQVIPSQGEERTDFTLPPEQIVVNLATAKATSVFSLYPDCRVLGADTIVYFNGKVLGKPKDKAEAVATLKALSGNEHFVYTGVCLIDKNGVKTHYARSVVEMNVLDDEFIENYVEEGSPMDKAGSYGIQDGGVVREYRGSYTNIVGLPSEMVEKMLKEKDND